MNPNSSAVGILGGLALATACLWLIDARPALKVKVDR